MLQEQSGRESIKNGRRWFSDEYFDLIVWVEQDENISGFQLCYDKNKTERALTWIKNKGYRHERVDDGETDPTKNRTPILVPDGIFPAAEITALFSNRSREIDTEIRSFVLEKLTGYGL